MYDFWHFSDQMNCIKARSAITEDQELQESPCASRRKPAKRSVNFSLRQGDSAPDCFQKKELSHEIINLFRMNVINLS